ncbi:hypothetical protein B0H21DRAFT_770539 [Amylocystis lapponica]|nr:hypothetical protein B0H21DRAFT_770539 [Amylocystis lapponica]
MMYLATPADFSRTSAYVNSRLFKDPNPLSYRIKVPARDDTEKNTKAPAVKKNETGEPAITHFRIFKRVGDYLGAVLAAEVEHGAHPSLNVPEDCKAAVKKNFQLQFRAYAMGHYPFSLPLGENQTMLSWWTHLQYAPQAEILAILAVKLYSVVPNSMADERTASTFTWINSPSRNRQLLETMVSQTQIRQYYRSMPKVRKHADPSPSVRFCDIDSLLLTDTSTHLGTQKKTSTAAAPTPTIRVKAAEAVDDGDMDNGDIEPWMDAKPCAAEAFGCSDEFTIAKEIDLGRGELLAMLDSEPAEATEPEVHSEDRDKAAGATKHGDGQKVNWEYDWTT